MSDISDRLRTLARSEHDDHSIGAEAADVIEVLTHEAALLREYVALLERTNCTLTGFAHAHGMISAPRDVAEGKRLRAAIAEVRGEGDG